MTVEYQCERIQRLRERGYEVTPSTSYDTSEWPRNVQVTTLTLSKHGVYIVVEFRGELATWVNGETVDVVWKELGSDDIQPGTEGEGLRRMVHENIVGAKTSIRQMLHDHGLHTITEPQRMRVTQRGAATLPRVMPHSPRAPVAHQIASLQAQFYRSIDEQHRAQIEAEVRTATEALEAPRPLTPEQVRAVVEAAYPPSNAVQAQAEMTAAYQAQRLNAAQVMGSAMAEAYARQAELDRRIIQRAAHLLPSSPIRIDVHLPAEVDHIPLTLEVTPTQDTTETFTPKRKVEID